MLIRQYRAVRILPSALTLGLIYSLSGFPDIAGSAQATPSSGFSAISTVGPTVFDEIDVNTHTDTDTLKVRIATKGIADVYIATLKAVPGGQSGWHSHLGPSLVSVTSGTATYYDGDDPTCTPHVVPAGEGFVDEGGGHVHLVRNETSVDLELVTFQIVPFDAARRTDAPSPGYCPF